MPYSHIDVEWTIVENDAEWKRLHDWSDASVVAASEQPFGHSRFWWRIMALLCVLALVNGEAWSPNQREQPQTIPELAASIPPLLDNAAVDLTGVLAYPIDAHTSADWQRQFAREEMVLWRGPLQHRAMLQPTTDYHVLEQQGNPLVVDLMTTTTLDRQVYRQTRFYARQAGGWLRIAPEEALWGTPQQLATPHFIFSFRARDAQTVTAVAPQLETLYTTMRRNFGLPLTPPLEKLAIEISVAQLPGFPSASSLLKRPLRVASPAIYLAPVALTDEQILAQAIALLLVEHLLDQVEEYYALPSAWQPLRHGLRLWQLWDLDLPLTAWREEIVQWLYIAMPATEATQNIVFPPHYEALCRMHQLWMANPWQLYIPLWCKNPQNKLNMVWWGQHQTLVQLTHLAEPVSTQEYTQTVSVTDRSNSFGQTDRMNYPGQTVTLAMLIDYAAATYGREHLRTLLASLRQYEQWATLIPAVYGVTPAEFEAGWQHYLAARYGISLETITRQ